MYIKERGSVRKVIVDIIAVLSIVAICMAADVSSVSSVAKPAVTDVGASHRTLTPQEAKLQMDQQTDLVVVDVRTQEEYAAGHIPSAVLLPVEQIEAKADSVAKVLPDKNAEIFVYCRSGKRAGRAAAALIEQGYTNVWNIGGIMDWPYEG